MDIKRESWSFFEKETVDIKDFAPPGIVTGELEGLYRMVRNIFLF
jgi:hypothetical protein